ncbi:MAG: alpha-L-fucosidase, partial [Pirellulales bacterium]|nr:alpha-L-fucosidase [Pirellulales bacterium]
MSHTRRDLLKIGAIGAGSIILHPMAQTPRCPAATAKIPPHLTGYEDEYKKDPRAAALKWFRDAKFGLFVHYGMLSPIPGGKRAVLAGKATLDGILEKFAAEKFDADLIADLAIEAGMKYLNFTPLHHGGLHLYRTKNGKPNIMDTPAHRDLVAELAEACRKRKLGFFLYVYHSIQETRPSKIKRNHAILREYLTQYGPLAGLWFDSIHVYYRRPELFPRLSETYAMIRELQPHCLISFKHGATGEEDFLAPEHKPYPPAENKHLPEDVRRKLAGKPVEICTTLQVDPKTGSGAVMWFNNENARHRTADEVMKLLADCESRGHNLLL